MRKMVIVALSLLVVGLAALPARPAQAQPPPELGYLWSLTFDFEESFDGLLTLKVGPWENGTLAAVDESSETKVACAPVGDVTLDGGDAVFAGGHISCRLDLAATVLANHGLVIDEIDSYAGMLLSTSLESDALQIAPIIGHPDASYRINFTRTSSVGLIQQLDNKAGPQSASFVGVVGSSRQSYAFSYACVWLGPCHGSFKAGGNMVNTPAGGDRIRFRTGPTTLLVGSDGASSFIGRMGNLFIDPGNSVH